MQETVSNAINDNKSVVKKNNVARKSTTKTPNFERSVHNGDFTAHANKTVKESEKSESLTLNGSKARQDTEKASESDKRTSPLPEDLNEVESPKVVNQDNDSDADLPRKPASGSENSQTPTRSPSPVNGCQLLKEEEPSRTGNKTDQGSPTSNNSLDILENSLNKLRESNAGSRNGSTASSREVSPTPTREGSNSNASIRDKDAEKSDGGTSPFSISSQKKDVFRNLIRKQAMLHKKASSDSLLSEKSCDSSNGKECKSPSATQKPFADKGNLFEILSDLSSNNAQKSDSKETKSKDESSKADEQGETVECNAEEAVKESIDLLDSEMTDGQNKTSHTSLADGDSEEIDESILDDSSDEKDAEKRDVKESAKPSAMECDPPSDSCHLDEQTAGQVTADKNESESSPELREDSSATVKQIQAKSEDDEMKGETANKMETEIETEASTQEADVEMKPSTSEGETETKTTKTETEADEKPIKPETDGELKAAKAESDVDMKTTKLEADDKVKATTSESDKEMKSEVKEGDEAAVVIKTSDDSEQASTRKRSPPPADSESDENPSAKKSRLDQLIGRLGSAVGKSPLEVDEDEDNTSQASVGSDVGSSDSTKSVSRSTVSTEDKHDKDKKSRAVSPSTVSTEDKDKKSRAVRMAVKDLETLIAKRLTKLLEKRQDVMLAGFRKRVEELQASNEKWKTQVKDLHKQVHDLTSQLQRSEKRRQSSARPNTRNMAVQVNEEKVQQVTSKIPSVQNNTVRPAVPAGQKTMLPVQAVNKVVLSTPPTGVVGTAAGATVNQGRVVQSSGMQYVASNNLRTIVQQAGQPVQAGSTATTTSGRIVNTTVRAMLDAQRVTTQRVVVQGSQIIQCTSQTVPSSNVITTMAKTLVPSKVMTPAAGKQAVIDLTDDDDQNNSQGKSKPSPIKKTNSTGATLSSAPQTLIRPGAAAVPIRPGTVLVPSTGGAVLVPRPGTGQVYVQQIVQNPRISTPGTSYVYTTQTGGAVTLAGTGAVRQTLAPPTLRPGQVVTMKTSGNQMVVNRQPPPLQSAPVQHNMLRHPAPLPPQPSNQAAVTQAGNKYLPPKPNLKISRVQQGIVLSWNMTINASYADIANYQLFAYQESAAPPNTSLWKKVGDVKALPLPMACTLTQFQEGNKYHFAVRAMDVHGRVGPFSDPNSIHLTAQITVS